MAAQTKIIRAARWYKVVAVLSAALFFVVSISLFYTQPSRLIAFASLLLPAVGALAICEVFRSRIILDDSSIEIVGLLGRRHVEKSRVSQVKLDGGVVFIQIEGGRWVELPHLGRSPLGVSNTVRAWHRRG